MSNTNTVANLFKIPEDNLADLQVKIAKLAKKAAKLGLEPITLAVGEFVDVPVLDEDKQPTGVIRRIFDVLVSGPTPKLAGWEFVATLEGMEGEVMIRTTPSHNTKLPTRFRNYATVADCEHCKLRRRRAETFVLQHDDGRLVQVGRQCLGDFLGGQNPQAVAAMAEMLWSACEDATAAEEDESGGGGGFGGGSNRVSTIGWLSFVAAAIRKEGWMSKAKAQQINEGLLAD